MDGGGDRNDAVEQAARVRESLARTLGQVRAAGPRPATDDDPTLDTDGKEDAAPRDFGALLARTRAVIEHTRRVIEQTRASIAGHPNADTSTPKREKLPKRD